MPGETEELSPEYILQIIKKEQMLTINMKISVSNSNDEDSLKSALRFLSNHDGDDIGDKIFNYIYQNEELKRVTRKTQEELAYVRR